MLNKTLFLEIDKPNYVPIYTVQYDYNSRFYEITILNNSQPLDLTGIRVIVAGKKPDGKEVFNSCKVLDAKKGLIQLELTEQMNAVNGASEYALELFSADGMLSSQPFKLIVTRSTISKSVESSKELGALKDALNEVQDIDNRFAQTNAQLSENNNKIEELASTGTTTEAIQNKVSELAQNGMITFDTVYPQMTTFLKLDTSKNIFGGKFEKLYITGSVGSMTVKKNLKCMCAILPIKPNTTLAIKVKLPNIDLSNSYRLKICTSSKMINEGEFFDGSIQKNVGKVYDYNVITVGENDKYLYIGVTESSNSLLNEENVFLKVIYSDIIPTIHDNEVYPYIPNGVAIYSSYEVDENINKAISNLNLSSNLRRKIKFEKIGNVAYVYIPSKVNDTYTRLEFSLTKSSSKESDIYRFYSLCICDSSFNLLHTLSSGYDMDGVVKIEGETDYIGGYHGYEKMSTAVQMLIDNKESNFYTDAESYCDNIRFIVKSNIQHYGTQTTVFDKIKVINISYDGWEIENIYSCREDNVNIQRTPLGLMTINIVQNDKAMISRWCENETYTITEIDTSRNNGAVITRGDNITSIEFLGDYVYANIKLIDGIKENQTGSIVYFTDNGGRLKAYLDPIRNSTLNSGDKMYSKVLYNVYAIN